MRDPARHSSRASHASTLTWVASVAAALVALVIVGPASYAYLAFSAPDKQDVFAISGAGETDADGDGEPDVPADLSAGQALNIAVIGIDSREGDNAEIAHDGDTAPGMRSDTFMVMHISEDRGRIDVVSIPRDSRVRIADCQYLDGHTESGWTTKFNAAFSQGAQYGNAAEGAACSMKTVTELTGVTFDGHYAIVDFAGFETMVDAIDGVPMCITEDMYSKDANLDLTAGAQVLDGEEALAFARARKGTGLGGDGTDLARIERQQELLTNTARKVFGMNLLTDVGELNAFLRAALESLTVDPGLGNPREIIGLAYSLRNFDTDNLNFYTVPWHYPGDESSDVVWTEPDATDMWQDIIDDQPVTIGEEPTDEGPTASATPTPSATASATSEPSVTPSPERESEQDILDSCVIP